MHTWLSMVSGFSSSSIHDFRKSNLQCTCCDALLSDTVIPLSLRWFECGVFAIRNTKWNLSLFGRGVQFNAHLFVRRMSMFTENMCSRVPLAQKNGTTDRHTRKVNSPHTHKKHINYFLLTRKYLNSVTAPAKSNACLYEIHINICHPIPYSIMWILIGLKPEPHRILVTTQYICTCGGWVRLITRRKCQLIEPVSSDRTRPRMVMVVCHYIKKPMFVRVQFHVIIQ